MKFKRYCKTLLLKDDPELIEDYNPELIEEGACTWSLLAGNHAGHEGYRYP